MPGYDNDPPDMKPDTPSENSLIQVHNVSKSFGLVDAVKNVSLDVTKGGIFGLVGSDGAGKSTLLRMIATMIRPSSGSIVIDGLDVVSQKGTHKTLDRIYAPAFWALQGSHGRGKSCIFSWTFSISPGLKEPRENSGISVFTFSLSLKGWQVSSLAV